MKFFLILFCGLILTVGCSNSIKDYETIKYTEKAVEVIEKYQTGDIKKMKQ